jgi:hypothetical protein
MRTLYSPDLEVSVRLLAHAKVKKKKKEGVDRGIEVHPKS